MVLENAVFDEVPFISLKFMFVLSFRQYLNYQVNVMIEVVFTRKVRTFGEVEISVLMFFSYPALVV